MAVARLALLDAMGCVMKIVTKRRMCFFDRPRRQRLCYSRPFRLLETYHELDLVKGLSAAISAFVLRRHLFAKGGDL